MRGPNAKAEENAMSRSAHPRRRGQALVEFTLVATMLLLLLLGVVQFGIVYSNQLAVTDAAREGARRAAINTRSGQAAMVSAGQTAARTAAAHLNQGTLTVAVTSGTGLWTSGAPITVHVEYPYDLSLLGIVVKSGNLTAETTMRAE